MSETQLDRIENMLKVLIKANTTISLKGTNTDQFNLRKRIEEYESKAKGTK